MAGFSGHRSAFRAAILGKVSACSILSGVFTELKEPPLREALTADFLILPVFHE
jgi:hypothetical protein